MRVLELRINWQVIDHWQLLPQFYEFDWVIELLEHRAACLRLLQVFRYRKDCLLLGFAISSFLYWMQQELYAATLEKTVLVMLLRGQFEQNFRVGVMTRRKGRVPIHQSVWVQDFSKWGARVWWTTDRCSGLW